MSDALDRLAGLAGIEEGWWDFFGTYRQVPAETKRAFLAAMGFAVEDEAALAASLAEFETRPWRRWLEPVQVASERDGAPTIVISIPDPLEDADFAWTVAEEDGATHHGQFRPRSLPMVEERGVNGVWTRRHAFRLPGPLQPGVHTLTLEAAGSLAAMTLIVAPARAHQPESMEQGDQKLWGFATQLYSLRSARNWGIGDFTDLAELGRQAAPLGAAAVGVNPLHALFPTRPERFSPYSPSGRAFVNVVYIDVEAVPDFAESVEAKRFFASPGTQARIAAAQNARLVDYPNVGALKLTLLELCWKHFNRTHLGAEASERGQAFRAFQRAGGRAAERFATFEALQDHITRQSPDKAYWRHWPAEYQDPESQAVAAFAEANRERVAFFWYLQWLADQQLAAAQAACRDGGMAVGIYRDMGVGIADDGAEAWGNQTLLCLGVSVGAPPDPLNLAGQDWGLVPFNPVTLREAAYRPLLDVLQANMAHAGAMRLDHAMSLQRLYWVPRGMKADQGAYVRYPVADLFGLVTLASRRAGCLVIGEDLGTVPDGFRPRMEEAAILGYRLMVFEKKEGEVYKRPDEITASALVSVGTHDLPSLPGWWQGIDIASRQRLGLYPDPAMGEQEWQGRERDRSHLVAAIAEQGLLPGDFPVGAELTPAQAAALCVAVYAYLDRSPAKLLMVQFEDVLGLVLQMNLPGTTDQHPNWRVRYPAATGEMLADARMVTLAESLRGRG
jgi:4-alpha-glucanotransferase